MIGHNGLEDRNQGRAERERGREKQGGWRGREKREWEDEREGRRHGLIGVDKGLKGGSEGERGVGSRGGGERER